MIELRDKVARGLAEAERKRYSPEQIDKLREAHRQLCARIDGVEPCRHPRAVPVDQAITGDTIAYLCPDCDTQLPEGFKPSDT